VYYLMQGGGADTPKRREICAGVSGKLRDQISACSEKVD
jgi:hypothetical protein